ncbi:MAG TPA: hypothetical protein VFC74_00285 [Oscillospiraceae bacterium]|nr:hypothetical protein [Oscillospiraceae bacterium]
MVTEIKEFDAMKVSKVALQYIGDEAPAVESFECLGSIGGETEMRTIVKRCGGAVRKSKSIPVSHTLTLSGHVPVKTLRSIYGLSNDELKAGVYSYGLDSKGLDFCLTADVVDEFEDVTKLVAFPNCSSLTGLKYTIDNDADEVAYVELEFDARPDDDKQFYYEAFVGEVDAAIASGWHTAFTRELVEEIVAG